MGCSMHAAYKDVSRFANNLIPQCAHLTESSRLSLVSKLLFHSHHDI